MYSMRHTPYVTPVTLIRQSCALFLPQESNWQKISELFVFVLYVALKKRISSKVRILSCFV